MNAREKARARRLLKSGKTVREVATRMKMNPLRIYRFRQAEGIESEDARQKLPEIKRLRRELVKAGSVAALAERYGVSASAVYWRLSRAKKD